MLIMKYEKKFYTFIIIIIASIFIFTCHNDEENIAQLIVAENYDGGEVTLSQFLPFQQLDPFKNRSWKARSLYYFIYDNLVDVDQNLHFVPRLAKSWQLSSDNRTITFQLRDDVRWHDSTLFTSEDVVYSYENYRKLSKVGHPERKLFDKVEKITILSPYSIKIKYKKPNTLALADWVIEIAQKPRSEKNEREDNTEIISGVGSGPFKVDSFDKASKTLHLSVFDAYWNGRAHLDGINIRYISYENGKKLLKKREIDYLVLQPNDISRKSLKTYKKKYQFFANNTLSYYYIGWQMNGSNPFFSHRKIRKAMTLALPRKELLKKLFLGYGRLCDIALPSWVREKRSSVLPYSPRVAVDLLREEGCKDRNSDGIREYKGHNFDFKLIYCAEDTLAKPILEMYKQSLRKLGIIMEPLGLPYIEFQRRKLKGNFDAFLQRGQVRLDCDNFDFFRISSNKVSASSVLGYKDKKLDKLIKRFFEETNNNDFQKHLNLIVDRLINQQPISYLFFEPEFILVRKGIRVTHPSPRGLWQWYPSILEWYIKR